MCVAVLLLFRFFFLWTERKEERSCFLLYCRRNYVGKGRSALGQTYKLMMTLWHDDYRVVRGRTCGTGRDSDHSQRIVTPLFFFAFIASLCVLFRSRIRGFTKRIHYSAKIRDGTIYRHRTSSSSLESSFHQLQSCNCVAECSIFGTGKKRTVIDVMCETCCAVQLQAVACVGECVFVRHRAIDLFFFIYK